MSEFIFSKEDEEKLERAISGVEHSVGSFPDKFQFYQNAFNKVLVHILLKSAKKESNEK